MKLKRDPIIFRTNLKFLLAFIFLGVFAVGDFIILHNQIEHTERSSTIISFMESQYSLVQKTTFLAVAYAQSIDVLERKALREEIHQGLSLLLLFSTTSNDIVSEKMHLPRSIVSDIRRLYTAAPTGLNDHVADYFSVIKKFLMGSPIRVSSDNPRLLTFEARSSKLLLIFRSRIGKFQEDTNTKIILLKQIGIILFIANLLCLGLIGILVFLPTVKTLMRYLARLKTMNQQLEIKVSERTSELEQKARELILSNEELRAQIDERLRAERELRKANAFLDSIIENIPDMLFIKDAEELRFVRFNRAGEELIGYSCKDLIGKNDYSLFPKEQADFFIEKDRQTLRNKTLIEITEEPIQTLKKGSRILHTKKIPILDSKGHATYLLGISEDITERIRSEQQLQELTFAMENALDGIARLDTNLKFLNANRSYAVMMGYNDPQDLVGLNQLTIICPEDQEKAQTVFDEMRKNGVAEAEVKVTQKSGTIFNQYMVLVRTLDKDKNFTGYYCFAKDITERKYQESIEIKAELIQMVSHELRTPIHSVKEGISIVLEGLTGELNEEQKEVLSISKRCIDRLVRLINDVLAFHRLEAGVIDFQMKKTDLNALLRETVETMRPLVENKNLALNLELEKNLPEIALDHDKIVQVITNFFQNAIKFTAQGCITIRSCLKPGGIIVSVKDTGIGIQQKDIPRLFRKFGQLESAKLVAPGGTGLGLAISKKIIEQHHGLIEVNSDYKKGSTFSFTLPLEQPKSSHPTVNK